MKKIAFTFVLVLTSALTFAQDSEKVTKYVTTFPNGEEAITITDKSSSEVLQLASADNFYKYEILESSNHELVHGATNNGNVAAIDKSKFTDGTYTLKVYTDDFVITSDITINNKSEESVQ